MDFHPDRPNPAPEVAFLGRSNVGKSSLLNALLGARICNTSSKPGRTRSMNAFAVHQGRLVVLDMPGYGKGSHKEWGTEILKYLTSRRQVRKAFLLIDTLHGPKDSDRHLLQILQENHIPHQIILSKVDRLLLPKGSSKPPSESALERNFSQLRRTMEDTRGLVDVRDRDEHGRETCGGEVLSCSAALSLGGKKLGMSGVRWAVLVAAGLESARKGKIKTRKTNITRDGHDCVQDTQGSI
ncbi:hypothetical protein GP486_005900 [Trichoglossum hirsutum]|uniref:GTP-binding protein 8 n=1 Tax=Trichoglossum hirsutum TaxID=265104 RepID=A0A9P8L8C5_9PEZI|nr:hypothetical protein GP486_005900 [Trichoglossum hirsutum]